MANCIRDFYTKLGDINAESNENPSTLRNDEGCKASRMLKHCSSSRAYSNRKKRNFDVKKYKKSRSEPCDVLQDISKENLISDELCLSENQIHNSDSFLNDSSTGNLNFTDRSTSIEQGFLEAESNISSSFLATPSSTEEPFLNDSSIIQYQFLSDASTRYSQFSHVGDDMQLSQTSFLGADSITCSINDCDPAPESKNSREDLKDADESIHNAPLYTEEKPIARPESPYVDQQIPPNNIETPLPVRPPRILISAGGLITVVLEKDINVEMTLDRAMRLVDHRNGSVAAVNRSGDMACIHHDKSKIYHDGAVTEVSLQTGRNVRMFQEGIAFASDESCFLLSPIKGLQKTKHSFQDLSRDMSVTVLFTSRGYGPHLVDQLESIVGYAKYSSGHDGTVMVNLNECLIKQNFLGDVTITSENSNVFMHMAPRNDSIWIQTSFCDMAMLAGSNVRARQGMFSMAASYSGLVVCDGIYDSGLTRDNQSFLRPVLARTHTVIRDGHMVDRLVEACKNIDEYAREHPSIICTDRNMPFGRVQYRQRMHASSPHHGYFPRAMRHYRYDESEINPESTKMAKSSTQNERYINEASQIENDHEISSERDKNVENINNKPMLRRNPLDTARNTFCWEENTDKQEKNAPGLIQEGDEMENHASGTREDNYMTSLTEPVYPAPCQCAWLNWYRRGRFARNRNPVRFGRAHIFPPPGISEEKRRDYKPAITISLAKKNNRNKENLEQNLKSNNMNDIEVNSCRSSHDVQNHSKAILDEIIMKALSTCAPSSVQTTKIGETEMTSEIPENEIKISKNASETLHQQRQTSPAMFPKADIKSKSMISLKYFSHNRASKSGYSKKKSVSFDKVSLDPREKELQNTRRSFDEGDSKNTHSFNEDKIANSKVNVSCNNKQMKGGKSRSSISVSNM